MLRSNPQQHLRRAGWRPPPLLPVLQRIGADAQNRRKLRLRQTELATHSHNVGLRVHVEHTLGLQLSPLEQVCFAEALLQFLKKFLFHNSKSSIILLIWLISWCDKFSRSPFG